MGEPFSVAPAILATSVPLLSLGLCEARLQSDARYPWIVLIPRRPGARELEHLGPADRARLMEETVAAGQAVRAAAAALGRPVEKLNVGALGNVTPQLHVHVVGRRVDDPAWPGPVWGLGEALPYPPAQLAAAVETAVEALKGLALKAGA
ncbi:diadenosine tetraphosphate hydrolase [Caulobacter sp. CCUG 60055]|uniref:HIT domain-containing protein n=1 Tax=Caulobacter sp. CCUG 60055 TaxID=2100090 RepID=UPI001FA6C7EB|nr:HIT domain-containing protein [Caulobacter sp. CCUG 60055]MBQ1543558.1 HIT domain-containing protein [Caulobacteraceae bacterium]MCI3181458.1 diadenosine tetraphosphate hydrolase [Caulobacter sp. CCUG 60055]